jgi:hypothetical protein
MDNPVLPPSKNISPVKLLGGTTFSSKKIKPESLLPAGGEGIKVSYKSLLIVKEKLIKVQDLLKESTLLQKEELEKLRKQKEKKKFKEKEEKLEKPSEKGEKKDDKKEPPKIPFLDRIKKFFFNLFLGYVVYRLIPLLPKLLQFAKILLPAFDFIVNIASVLFNALVTFIDWGYKAVDAVRGFIKSVGGENTLKLFDKFTSVFTTFVNAAVIISMLLLKSQGLIKTLTGETARKLTGGIIKGGLTRTLTRAGIAVAGKAGGTFIKGGIQKLSKVLNKIPIIGGLIDFGILVLLGEDPGRAAARAVGSTAGGALGGIVAGAIGSIVPFAGTVLGGIIGSTLGSFLGDWAGGALYDAFAGAKKETQKAASGGTITRGGKIAGSIKRTLRKPKVSRTVSVKSTPLKPGSDIGGEEKIKKIFPDSENQSVRNPFKYIAKSEESFSKVSFFGPILSLASKIILGQKPDDVDYKNIGAGLNAWMYRTFSGEILRGGAFAGGGEVNAEMFMGGEDLTNIISKSVEESVSPKVDESINELMKQLGLKEITPEPDKSDPTLQDDDTIPMGGTPGQWGPLLDLISGKESGGNYEAMYPSTTLKGATKMTIAEVARRATGAVGKYQQLPQYLVGRAKAAGLNPDKDLYSPENQEKIIINVNIKGRGGEKWLKGEISDEQFMQGLSQEFASLPNASGRFHYRGQSSSMTPQKVKAALSQVKKGGYSTSGLTIAGGGTGSGYGSGGIKIAGDLGDYLKQNRSRIGVTGEIHQHPRHPGLDRRGYSSFHNVGRALDIGGYGPAHPSSGGRDEQAPVIRALLAWNKKHGYTPVELIHGSPAFRGLGKYESAPNALHSHHVHVAYFGGGFVGRGGNITTHPGEFVIDKDSVDLFGRDFMEIVNDVENASQRKEAAQKLMSILSSYAEYEMGSTQEVIVDDERSASERLPIVVMQDNKSQYFSGFGDVSDPYESIAMNQ